MEKYKFDKTTDYGTSCRAIIIALPENYRRKNRCISGYGGSGIYGI